MALPTCPVLREIPMQLWVMMLENKAKKKKKKISVALQVGMNKQTAHTYQ